WSVGGGHHGGHRSRGRARFPRAPGRRRPGQGRLRRGGRRLGLPHGRPLRGRRGRSHRDPGQRRAPERGGGGGDRDGRRQAGRPRFRRRPRRRGDRGDLGPVRVGSGRAAVRTAPARTPLVVAVLGVVALVVIVGPLLALGIRVPWERFGEVLRDSATAELLRVTFLAAAWATLLTTLL